MALSIIFTASPEIALKSCNVNKPLYYVKLVLKKDKCLGVENNSGVKVWQSHFNSLIKRLFNFHAVFSNSDRKRYISEAAIGDLQLY